MAFWENIEHVYVGTFFDITKDSSNIFKDTAIMRTEFADQINQWPTIFISFAGAKHSKEEVVSTIKKQILEIWQLYKHVFANLDEFDSPVYDSLKASLCAFNNGKLSDITDAISFLMRMLEKYYHKKVMLLIDEYDTPFIEAHVFRFYDDISGGLSSLLHKALKLSSSLQYAMITGIQRVAKENIFSNLNNLAVCTVSDNEYSQYFGFTELETKKLLEEYHLTLSHHVKLMYDGYHIGTVVLGLLLIMQVKKDWSLIG